MGGCSRQLDGGSPGTPHPGERRLFVGATWWTLPYLGLSGGAAEFLGGDVLAGHRLDDSGPVTNM